MFPLQQRRFNFFDELITKDPQDPKKNFESLKLSLILRKKHIKIKFQLA